MMDKIKELIRLFHDHPDLLLILTWGLIALFFVVATLSGVKF